MTRSFYVAAFFAVETADEDAVIWAVDGIAIHHRLEALVACAGSQAEENARLLELANTLLREGIGANEPNLAERQPPLVLPLETLRRTEREVLQQSVYLLPTSLTNSIESCLAATLGLSDSAVENAVELPSVEEFARSSSQYPILRMILPKDAHPVVLRDLEAMNVTAASLFPGLDGFARSMCNALTFQGHVPIDFFRTPPPAPPN